MGEVAGIVFCGWVLRKQTIRQRVSRNQQGQGPWLGLRHRQGWVKFPNGGSMGTICPGLEPEMTGLMLAACFKLRPQSKTLLFKKLCDPGLACNSSFSFQKDPKPQTLL